MATPKSAWLSIADLRGGRNGHDAPEELQENECADAVNVEWGRSTFGRKRGGATPLSTANSPFTGIVSSLARHIPSVDDTAAELWGTDDAATPHIGRLAAGNWSTPTVKDAPTGNGWDFSYASIDGKLFVAYQSAENRLHCWDGTTLRRAGLAVPDAPTAADAGSGTYAATTRFYRARWAEIASGLRVRQSDPGLGVQFTPSGTGASVTVTQPTPAGEGETHWILEVSLDNATYYELAEIAIATTTYSDSAATTTYADNSVSVSVGSFALQKPYRFIRTDQGRLLGFGSYNPLDPQNRIEFSAVVGGSTLGAAEISPVGSNFVGLTELAAGGPTGLEGPLNGSFFAFLFNQIWKLTPTGNALQPYSLLCISPTIGAVSHLAIVMAEDEAGNPCLYWMSARGIYRWGGGAIQYIGNGVEDLILGPTSVMNTAAKVICHAVYHSDKRQIWFYVAVGTDEEPTVKLVWNIGRIGGTSPSDHPVPSGWCRNDGESAKARASVMFSDTVGATMSRTLKPYIAYSGANATIWKTDSADTTDANTPYQAFIVSRAMQPWGMMVDGEVGRSYVQAVAAANVAITQTMTGNYGQTGKSQTSTASLTPTDTETRVFRRFGGTGLGTLNTVQFTWGDDSAIDSAWHIDKVVLETSPEDVA